MQHEPITHLRPSSYRRRPLWPLLKDIGMVLFLVGLLYAILITLGGWAR